MGPSPHIRHGCSGGLGLLPDVFLSSPVVLAGGLVWLGSVVVPVGLVLVLPAAPIVSVASFAASVALVSAMPVSASVSALPIVEVGADDVGAVAGAGVVVAVVSASVTAGVLAVVDAGGGVLAVTSELGAERLQPDARVAPIRTAPAMEEVMSVLESMEFSVWLPLASDRPRGGPVVGEWLSDPWVECWTSRKASCCLVSTWCWIR